MAGSDLTDIDPSCAGHQGLQLFIAQLDGGIGAAAGRIDPREALQGDIQIDGCLFRYGKRADAAHRMVGVLLHFVRLQHARFDVEGLFELMIVDLAVAGADDEKGMVASHEGERLGDALRTSAQRLCGKLHRCAGRIQLDDVLISSVCFQVFSY